MYRRRPAQNSYSPEWQRLTPDPFDLGRPEFPVLARYRTTSWTARNIVAAPGCSADKIDAKDKPCKMDILPYAPDFNASVRLASNTHFNR
jgi:iron complex outermembrane receptor protein